jgi:hypothetical protein
VLSRESGPDLVGLGPILLLFLSSTERATSTRSTPSDVSQGRTSYEPRVGPFAFRSNQTTTTHERTNGIKWFLGEAAARAALLCRFKQQDSFAMRLSCTTSSVVDRRLWTMVKLTICKAWSKIVWASRRPEYIPGSPARRERKENYRSERSGQLPS